jgi:hypothetical protein
VAVPTVAAVRLGLWVLPGPLVRTVVDRAAARAPRPGGTPLDPGPIADAVRRASRWVPRASCLVQALSAQALLALAGSPGTIVLGVARSGDALAAHAWVEHSGRVVIGEGPPPGHTVLGGLRSAVGPSILGRDR